MTETRAYRIDDVDHYKCLSLLLLRSILIYIVYLDDSALLQCRIGLISEVIVIGIYSDQRCQSYMPLFQSLFCNPILSFSPKTFLCLFILLLLLVASERVTSVVLQPLSPLVGGHKRRKGL